jgi:hypothetical protein
LEIGFVYLNILDDTLPMLIFWSAQQRSYRLKQSRRKTA